MRIDLLLSDIKYFNRYTKYIHIYLVLLIAILILKHTDLYQGIFGIILSYYINQGLYNKIFYEMEISYPYYNFPVNMKLLFINKNIVAYIFNVSVQLVIFIISFKTNYLAENIIIYILLVLSSNLLLMIYGAIYFLINTKKEYNLFSNFIFTIQLVLAIVPFLLLYRINDSVVIIAILNIIIDVVLIIIWHNYIIPKTVYFFQNKN